MKRLSGFYFKESLKQSSFGASNQQTSEGNCTTSIQVHVLLETNFILPILFYREVVKTYFWNG